MLLNASGCLDALVAPDVARAFDAFVTKTVTPEPRDGNPPVRIAETEFGMLNAIGLANPGRERFVAYTLPRLRELGDRIAVLGPLGNGFRLDVERPLLVGGGIGVAPLPYLSDVLGAPPAVIGFRSDRHAEAASLLPHAEVVLEPTYVTDAMPPGRDVLACGPEPMLEAVRRLAPDAQLAWEAPMACGYGACYGCAVEIGGELKRLCVEGPVLTVAPWKSSLSTTTVILSDRV